MGDSRQGYIDSAAIRVGFEKKTLDLVSGFNSLWNGCRSAFCEDRTYERARRLALSMLVCLGRHTISSVVCTAGRQLFDWSADYRLFSKAVWDSDMLFDPVREGILNMLPDSVPFVTAIDDTNLRKTGKTIPGVKYTRDPMSPPFHTNFIRGQRFCQISALLPERDGVGPARAIPIEYQHVPPVPKPKRSASIEDWQAYGRRCREQNLSIHAAQRIVHLREKMDEDSAHASRKLVTVVDGSFCNSTVLKRLPERTCLIGRIRSDAKLYFPFETTAPSLRGRPRRYGELAPTPEQLRRDDSIPWQQVKVFATGRLHSFHVKRLRPVFWRKAGVDKPLQVVVIRPLGYRPRKGSRTLYRQPAYLICTDPDLPLDLLVQYYVWRWDIEVNHRDEKQIIGVGQAQVRNPKAVERVPAFAVASYAMLLLAAAQIYGTSNDSTLLPLPKWRNNSTRHRIPTQDLIRQLRHQLWADVLNDAPVFIDHFQTHLNPHTTPKKTCPALSSAVLYAMA